MESPTHSRESKERKSVLIESLSRQVNVVKELLQKADELSSLSPNEASEALIKIENGLLEKFPEETQQRYKELLLVREKLREIESEINDINDREPDNDELRDTEAARIETLYNDAKSAEQKILELTDAQTDFIAITSAGIATLRKKTEELSRRRTDDTSNDSEQTDDRNFRFLKEDIVATQTDAFSTVHIVKSAAWKKQIRATTRGFYVQGTNDIYVNEDLNSKRLEATIKHERTHNLLDGFETHKVKRPTDRLRTTLRRLWTLKKVNAPDSTIKREISVLTNEVLLQDLLDSTHNEFLAEFDEASRYSFKNESMNSFLMRIEALSKEQADIQSIDVTEATRSMATAGNHVQEVLIALQTLPDAISKIGLPEYSEQVTGLKEKFERMFLGMITNLRQQINTAKILGSEAEKEVSALVHLLKPSHYRHIKTYLEETHGIHTVERAERCVTILFERKFSLNTLKEMVDGFKSGTDKLSEETVEDFINSSVYVHEESIPNTAEYIEVRSLCIQLLTTLSEIHPQIEVNVNLLAEEVTNLFFSKLVKESVPEMITILEGLPSDFFSESEREGLEETFQFLADPKDLPLFASACSRHGITIDFK